MIKSFIINLNLFRFLANKNSDQFSLDIVIGKMAITVQFFINWLSIVIPNYDKLVASYRKANKNKKSNQLIELIYDSCLTEAQKNHNIEAEPNFHDADAHRKLRHNNIKKIKGRLQIKTSIPLFE